MKSLPALDCLGAAIGLLDAVCRVENPELLLVVLTGLLGMMLGGNAYTS